MEQEHWASAGTAAFRMKIIGMDCGSCASTIEQGLRKLPGAQRVAVDFTTETLEIDGLVSRAQVEHRLRQLGYGLAEPGSAAATLANSTRAPQSFLRFVRNQRQQRLALVGTFIAILAASLVRLAPSPGADALLWCVLVATVLIVGAPIFGKGLRALLFSRRVTIDLLMTLAALGALFIGETGEAATVVLLFTFGEGLEGFSASRARDSLRSLMSLQPQTATVLSKHGAHDHEDHGHDGDTHGHDHEKPHNHNHDHEHTHEACDHTLEPHTHSQDSSHEGHDHAHGKHDHHGAAQDQSHEHTTVVPAEQLSVGDLILVRPGERIAADGVIRSGASSVNQAAVTGESIPVTKSVGDTVMAGTINAEGALQVEVTRKAADSTVARIAHLVEQAQARRSPTERFIDQFARWYTPAVVVLAIVAVIVPVLFLGLPLLDSPDGTRGWLYRGLALLIVACPCALVISIPVTVVSSLTRLARLGVLVKGGEQLDRLAVIRTIAFDKTGTLTLGRPSVTAVQARGCAHEAHAEPACVSCDDVIALAATVERSSEHPIAYAIMESAQARGLASRYPAAVGITAIAGRGVTGELQGIRIAVGTDALLSDQGAQANLAEFRTLRQSNRTVMTVARNSEIVGAIGVEDTIRAESRSALSDLRSGRPAIRTVMLTGDSQRVADDIAEKVGAIDEVRAGLLPEDKLAAIQQLQRDYGPVAMVGDGINDAPALARADVGIAMGGAGTAQAMETADVVLMQDDLRCVPMVLRMARRTRTLVKQNIALSLGLKLAFLALVIPGWATLWLAVVADVGATVIVTLNGMRMLRQN